MILVLLKDLLLRAMVSKSGDQRLREERERPISTLNFIDCCFQVVLHFVQ